MLFRLPTFTFLAALALFGGLSGCGVLKTTADVSVENLSAKEIYDLGETKLNKRRHTDAAQYFGEVERLYPYSEWAKRGVIMQAFAFHLGEDYENSRAAAQRYIDFYPADDDAAYAQYLLALSYYDQIDEVGRDQGLTVKALQELRKVIELYPNSKYAKESVDKFDLAMNHLAAKEMEVGRYYLKRGHFGAAVKRFRIVVQDFQTTAQTPEALHRLVEAYLSLGLKSEAQAAGAILGHNYKDTQWYNSSYDLLTQKGLKADVIGNNWLSQVYRQTIKGEWL